MAGLTRQPASVYFEIAVRGAFRENRRPMPTPEAAARENIDAALQRAGWHVQDFTELNLAAGLGVAVREFSLARGHGKADYALYVAGKLAGVVEAKKEGTLLTGIEVQSDSEPACSGCHCRGDCGRPACGP